MTTELPLHTPPLNYYQLRAEFRVLLNVADIRLTQDIEHQCWYASFKYQTEIYSIPVRYGQSALEALQNYPELLI